MRLPDIHMHIHVHQDPETTAALTAINNQLQVVIDQGAILMTLKDDIAAAHAATQTALTTINDNVTNMSNDITNLVNSLPTDGGLTADETAAIREQALAIQAQAEALVATSQAGADQV